MRVLIFEPDSTGHRLHHVRNILLALQDCSQEITIALGAKAAESPEFSVHLADVSGNVTIDCWMPPFSGDLIKGGLQRAQMLRESIRRSRAQWVYVPYADGLSQLLGARRMLMLPSIPHDVFAEGLMMRGGFAYPQPSMRSKLAANLSWWSACRAPWTVMHILDPIVYDKIQEQGGRRADWCRLMPDPVEVPESDDRAAARHRLGLARDGQIIGCVGIIDSRKGMDLLINAFAAANLGPQVRLLLAGKHDRTIVELLSGSHAALVQQGRIISMNRILETQSMLDALTAMDVVGAIYPRHIGSASIAIRAAAAQRPVLASNFGWLGAIVPRFGLGWTCDATNPAELQQAIASALQRAADFRRSEAAGRFVAFHSIENFRAHWTAEIRRHLNLPQSTELRTWQWASGSGATESFKSVC
jgi:hypothetical protein